MTKSLRPACVLSIAVTMAVGCGGDDGTASTSETSTGDESTTTTGTATETTESETGDEPSDLIEIPGATYAMGCGASDQNCDADNPEHQVTVSTFMIERTEVSVAAYQACIDAGSCTAPPGDVDCNLGVTGRDEHPVNCVTWQQAVDYCGFVGRRLPTEAEWELAAAGPDSRPYPWGSGDANCMLAHMFQMSGDMGGYGCLTNMTSVVDNYENGASIDGVLQLAGNVAEWVADWYAADYYASGENMDPQGPVSGTNKIGRGGSYLDASPQNLRVFERGQAAPDQTVPQRGFRCAL